MTHMPNGSNHTTHCARGRFPITLAGLLVVSSAACVGCGGDDAASSGGGGAGQGAASTGATSGASGYAGGGAGGASGQAGASGAGNGGNAGAAGNAGGGAAGISGSGGTPASGGTGGTPASGGTGGSSGSGGSDVGCALRAFPSAVGFGKNTTGGRGGYVVHVTNLNDSGAGSLRAALAMTGARTIVFDVGGTINAKSYLAINSVNGNVTIAGETAPGGGILIKNGELRISASNVIVRYLRIRHGNTTTGSNEDGINVSAYSGYKLQNLIVDHCSVSWARDENVAFVGGFSGSTISNCTVQNSLIAESGYGALSYKNVSNVTYYRNLFAHNTERNVRANYATGNSFEFEMINNIAYGYKAGTNPTLGLKFSVINNKYKASSGVSVSDSNSVQGQPISAGEAAAGVVASTTHAHIQGNIKIPGQGEYSSNLAPYLKSAPYANSGITPLAAAALEADMLGSVGASLPARDAVDTRLINQYKAGNGGLQSSGTFPTIAGGTAPTDTDQDGMPDAWESARGLDPKKADNNGDDDKDGYTNLEEYLQFLTGDAALCK